MKHYRLMCSSLGMLLTLFLFALVLFVPLENMKVWAWIAFFVGVVSISSFTREAMRIAQGKNQKG